MLGAVALDEWHALRLDIVTKADDPRLGDQDLRLDYYLDGELKASRIPEDSAILIDPARTGLGPHRSLVVTATDTRETPTGTSTTSAPCTATGSPDGGHVRDVPRSR